MSLATQQAMDRMPSTVSMPIGSILHALKTNQIVEFVKDCPHMHCKKKIIHNFTGNVSTTLFWPVAFYRDYAEFVCCFVHVTKKDLQIKDTLHLILLLNKQNFSAPPPFNNNNMRISNVTNFLIHLLLSSIGTGVYITYSVCKFKNLLNS